MGEYVVGSCENMDVLFYEQSVLLVNSFLCYDKNVLWLNFEGYYLLVVQEYRGNGKLGIYENLFELFLFKMVFFELEKFIVSNMGLIFKGNFGGINLLEFILFNLILLEFEKIFVSVQNQKLLMYVKGV